MDSMTDLRNYLGLIGGFPSTHRPDWVYQNQAGLVLAEGVEYHEVRLAVSGPPKECFTNAWYAASEHGWTYVEGYAASIIPVEHAWCVDENGVAVETTWETPGTAYLGIPFDTDWVGAQAVEAGHWGVLGNDWRSGHQLLRNGIPVLARASLAA